MLVRPARHELGDVDGERRLPADVLGDEPAVAPHARPVVDRPEVDEHPVVAARGERLGRDGAAVPDDRVELPLPDPRRRRLRRERHLDRAVERRGPRFEPALGDAGIAVVVGELPGAVKAGPRLTAQHRSGYEPSWSVAFTGELPPDRSRSSSRRALLPPRSMGATFDVMSDTPCHEPESPRS